MTEFIRSYPPAAPIIGDILVKALDWPQADEIAERIKATMPPQAKGGLPPELQQMIEGGKKQIEQQGQQIQQMQAEKQITDKQHKLDLAEKDIQIKVLQGEKQLGSMMQQATMPAPAPAAPVSVNLAENIGESVAQAIVPAVTQAVSSAVASLPPLQVQMPPPQRMRRRPVRDANGMILETIDEPIMEQAND